MTLNSNGSFTYTPTTNYTGSDSFSYRDYDGCLYSSPVFVSLTVQHSTPVAVNDAYLIHTSSLSVSAPGLQSNDSNAGGTSFIGENGSLHVSAAGYLSGDTDADGDSRRAG